MGHLLGIRIQRYKALRDVTLGKYEYDANKDDLPALTALIGPNGSGKSTVLDAFVSLPTVSPRMLRERATGLTGADLRTFEAKVGQGRSSSSPRSCAPGESDSRAKPIAWSFLSISTTVIVPSCWLVCAARSTPSIHDR